MLGLRTSHSLIGHVTASDFLCLGLSGLKKGKSGFGFY